MLHELVYTCGAYRYCEYGPSTGSHGVRLVYSAFGTPCRQQFLDIECPKCDSTDMGKERMEDLEFVSHGLFEPPNHGLRRPRVIQHSPYLYPPQDDTGRLL